MATSIKITLKNKEQLIKDTDFSELDYVYFPVTMAGEHKSEIIFNILNQMLYSNKVSPPSSRNGRSLKYHKLDNVFIGTRHSATTCYFYCGLEEPSAYYSQSSQRKYNKIDDCWYIKHEMNRFRKLREEQKDKIKNEEIKKQQAMFDKLILKNILIDVCEYSEELVSEKESSDSIVHLKYTRDRRYGWANHFKHISLSQLPNNELQLSIPELNLKSSNREDVERLLIALKSFADLSD